jgi:hypothetical protein
MARSAPSTRSQAPAEIPAGTGSHKHGVLAITAGFLLQAAALGGVELSIVEPILVLELPATLILASRVFGARMHKREWGATAAMASAVVMLMLARSPLLSDRAGQQRGPERADSGQRQPTSGAPRGTGRA